MLNANKLRNFPNAAFPASARLPEMQIHMEPFVQRIHNPRVRPDHKDMTDVSVSTLYARPKPSFLEGLNKERHVSQARVRMYRRYLNARVDMASGRIWESSHVNFLRLTRRDMDELQRNEMQREVSRARMLRRPAPVLHLTQALRILVDQISAVVGHHRDIARSSLGSADPSSKSEA
jgi:hypothetical protein